jgi:preprotein translocase subunit SecE
MKNIGVMAGKTRMAIKRSGPEKFLWNFQDFGPGNLSDFTGQGFRCIMGLSVYKRGQGKYTRMISAFGGAAIVAIGCLQLYRTLDAADIGLWVETMVPVGLFIALSVLMMWMVNKPSIADFMISSEGEMKKVNWSTRQEVAVSTIVVISVVIILAVLLGVSDFVLQLSVGWLVQ